MAGALRCAMLVPALALVAAGCARPAPRLMVGPLATGTAPTLAALPLAPGQNLRADEITRTASASYHVVQIRRAETPHTHATHDLTVLVLRGAGTLTLGTERLPMRAGDVALIPRGVVHWYANAGRGASVALVVFTPPLDGADIVPVAIDSSEGDR